MTKIKALYIYAGLLLSILIFVALIVPLLINVAFVTLLERKILALRQRRVGPEKTGLIGLLQPFADVVKLLMSQIPYPTYRLKSLFLLTPAGALSLAIIFRLTFTVSLGHPSWEFRFLFILMILRLNVYPLLLRGWSSNRVYAYLGRVRGVAQTISYEISLAFILLALFSLLPYIAFRKISDYNFLVIWWILPLFFLWGLSAVAELNRTPFDFSEGESELVSGFNVEYGRTKFAIFFMAEYLIILRLSFLTAFLFLGQSFSKISRIGFALRLVSLVIWLRATYPRFRYDILMLLAWKTVLPWRLGLAQLCRRLLLVL